MIHENHRRDTRVEVRLPVVVLRGKLALALETRDMSYRGLFVCTQEPPALRSLVRLRVSLPTRTFETHAMVVHVVEGAAHETGVGLQFWGLSGPDRKAWDDVVRQLMQAQHATLKKSQLTLHTPHPAGTEPVSGVLVVSSDKAVPETGSDT